MRTRFALLSVAVLAVAALPVAAQQPDTVRIIMAPTRTEGLVTQLARLRAEIESLRAELARTGSTDAATSRALRTTIESLEQSKRHLEEAIREHGTLVRTRQLEEQAVSAARVNTVRARGVGTRPAGYIGVTTQNTFTVRELGSGRTVQVEDLPVIVTVAPGSPAHRAGLAAGDTVLAVNSFDGRLLQKQLVPLLRPGDTISFRIRRGEETRMIAVQVEPLRGTYTVVGTPSAGGGGRSTVIVGSTPSSTTPVATGRAVYRPAPAVGGTVVSARSDSGARGGAVSVFMIREAPALAGMRLEPLSSELASQYDVESGLLVLSVAAETPAARAGLQAGDVITGTANTPIASLPQFYGAMLNSSAKALELSVRRDGKARTVTLRW